MYKVVNKPQDQNFYECERTQTTQAKIRYTLNFNSLLDGGGKILNKTSTPRKRLRQGNTLFTFNPITIQKQHWMKCTTRTLKTYNFTKNY